MAANRADYYLAVSTVDITFSVLGKIGLAPTRSVTALVAATR